MAEVVGLLASGISIAQLAGQVAKSIIQLKSFWDEVKEAPTEIKYLINQLDSLNLILSQIEAEQSSSSTTSISVGKICVQQSLKLCMQGADELSDLVDELARKLESKHSWSRKVGSAKVVLKKDEMKRLKGLMEYAM